MLVQIYLLTLAFIIVTALVFLTPVLPQIDQVIYQINREFLSDGHVLFMKQITHLGDGEVFVALSAIVFFYLLFLQKFKPAIICAVFATITRGINPIIKEYFARERPFSSVSEASGFSFPSGHSANIAFLALLIYSLLAPNAQQDYRLRLMLCFFIFLVGISRVSLEVHWMSDVLAGWSLGLMFGLLHLYFQRKAQE